MIQTERDHLEEIVLGSVLLESRLFTNEVALLPNEIFKDTRHRLTWKAIGQLNAKKEPIDLMTIIQQLRLNSHLDVVGGAFAVSTFTNQVASTANFKTHLFYLKQQYFQQKATELLLGEIKLLESGDINPDTRIVELKKEFDKISSVLFPVDETTSLDNQADILLQHIEDVIAGRKEAYAATEFRQLDIMINGLTRADLICIAARPGMGKTAFVTSIVRNLIRRNVPVLIFTLEMPAMQLLSRLAAQLAYVNAQLLRDPMRMTPSEKLKLYEWINKLKAFPLFIDDSSSITWAQIAQKTREFVKKHEVRVMIVDYLQLVKGTGKHGSREQEISEISREMKVIAKELDITVIELSQLSREVEKRAVKIPMLSDLRESGAIEQDADVVAFLYRPEYYDIDRDGNGNDLSGIMQVIIAKSRHGALGNVYLHFDKLTTGVFDSKLKEASIEHTNPANPVYPKKNTQDDIPF